jgi:hypothetical protein
VRSGGNENQHFLVTASSNTPYISRRYPHACCCCLSYTFLKIGLARQRKKTKISPPRELTMSHNFCAAFVRPDIPTRPSLAPRAVRSHRARSATLDEPLIRERLFYPHRPHLWTSAGQWPVCCADASPTEDPCCFVHDLTSQSCYSQFLFTPRLANVSRKSVDWSGIHKIDAQTRRGGTGCEVDNPASFSQCTSRPVVPAATHRERKLVRAGDAYRLLAPLRWSRRVPVTRSRDLAFPPFRVCG